jgi:hypothetical protein
MGSVLPTLGPIRLAELIELPLPALRADAQNVESLYRTRKIWRKGKERLLRLPSKELKRIQRKLSARFFSLIPPHPAAYCHRGRGALAAARLHSGHPWMYTLDIRDFFPSVTRAHVAHSLAWYGVPAPTRRLVAKLITVENQLPQGASTSVAAGNLVLSRLDRRIGGLARKHGLTYTRYVDDLCVSGGKRIRKLESHIRRIVAEDWEVHPDKGGVVGPDERHQFLGLIVNTRPNVSSAYVRDIRDLLRTLRAAETPLLPRDASRLRGRISYIRSVNRSMGDRLREEFKLIANCN